VQVTRLDYFIGAATEADPVPLSVGDEARTDGSGYAEIAFFDGSVTRLDVDTDIVIAELIDDPDEAMIRIGMGLGRTWHRVPPLSDGESYEVETPVGTAVVRGTSFFVSCPLLTECTFAAVAGSLELELSDDAVVAIEAPAWVTVADGEVSDPEPLPFDSAFGDDWLFDNGIRDQVLGSDGPGQLYARYGVAYASLAGTYDSNGNTTRFDCEGPGCEPFSELVHQPIERTYEFVVECEVGACGGRATTEYQYNEEFVNENVPLRFDGSAYRWDLDARGDLCFSADGARFGELSARFDWTLAPTAADVIDGRYVVTFADLDITVAGTPVEPVPAACEPFLVTYSMDQFHTVTRQP
jgi:hypothetical protein